MQHCSCQSMESGRAPTTDALVQGCGVVLSLKMLQRKPSLTECARCAAFMQPQGHLQVRPDSLFALFSITCKMLSSIFPLPTLPSTILRRVRLSKYPLISRSSLRSLRGRRCNAQWH